MGDHMVLARELEVGFGFRQFAMKLSICSQECVHVCVSQQLPKIKINIEGTYASHGPGRFLDEVKRVGYLYRSSVSMVQVTLTLTIDQEPTMTT